MSGELERRRPARMTPAAIVLLIGVALLSLHVRYEDVLASPVMPAEDPYTHLVFTREHMDRGHFGDSFHMGTTLYPPGMHALLGIFWALSDVDLYQFMRLGAPFWGLLATVGTFLLAHRFGGLAAGVTAGVLVALMPEHIVRTNFFVPTAMDLAFLPFYLWGVMEVVDGRGPSRLAWLAVAGVLGAALTVSHPWIIPLTAAPILLYAGVRLLVAPATTRPRARSVAAVAAVPIVLLLLAVKTRWKQSDSGLGDIVEDSRSDLIAETAFAVLNPWFLGVAVLGVVAVVALARLGRPRVAAAVASLAVALELFITIPILAAYPPAHVDYARQLGTVAIWMAVLGAIALPLWLDNRVAQMGAALALVTFPVTAVNFFQSPYLPHRTVAYLSVGVALLGGGLAALVSRHLAGPEDAAGGGGAGAGAGAAAFVRRGRVPNVAMSGLVAVAVAGLMMGPASAEVEPWYRYYSPAEFEGFEEAAAILEADPDAVVVSGDWRANMMLKTLTPELSRVWYSEEYFFDEGARWDWNGRARDSGLTLYVVVERYEVERYGDMPWTAGLETVWSCPCGTFDLYRATGGGN